MYRQNWLYRKAHKIILSPNLFNIYKYLPTGGAIYLPSRIHGIISRLKT